MGNISKLSHTFSLKIGQIGGQHHHHENDTNKLDQISLALPESVAGTSMNNSAFIGDDEELIGIYGDLLRCVENNNVSEFNNILFQHNLEELFDQDSFGNLLLKASEVNANLTISTALINLTANVNCSNIEQSTSCLMMATKNDNTELVRLLLQSGAKVNATDNYGWTALFYASYFGCVNCAKILLDNKAHVNIIDQDGMSCIIWASGRGHCGVVELLLEYGACVNSADRYNTSSLIWASRKGNTDIVDILVKNGARINERGMYGWTTLIVAVKGNHIEATKLLLEHKPNLNICDGEKMSPLLIACNEGFKEIALELIEHGANINQFDGNGNTPLIWAAYSKCFDIVKALVEAGALIEYANQDDRNAVHWAVIRNDIESFKLFLELGIDTNLTTSSGETYLLLAAKHSSWDIIKLLHEHNNPITSESIANETLCSEDDNKSRLSYLEEDSSRKIEHSSSASGINKIDTFLLKPTEVISRRVSHN